MTVPAYDLPERVGLVLEAHASDPLNELAAEICRIAAAEALRGLVAEATSLGTERARHYLSVDVLTARADYLDPEGATR